MAIQVRRGAYADFDTTKMRPGEPAVVLQDDPVASDGKAAYIAFAPGDVKRLATYDDVEGITDDIVYLIAPEFSEGTAYSIGDYVYYDGLIYRFTTDHAAGAWNSSHVTQVTVGEELERMDFSDRLKKGSGTRALIEGDIANNVASGSNAHAEGYHTTASGQYSHAEGSYTQASQTYAHAEGYHTTASGQYSHAEGSNTTASAFYSHAEGSSTTASSQSSHAEGSSTTASGWSSHAEGYYTKASSDYQHVSGKYNIEDTHNKYAEIIGNGTTGYLRSNARTLDWDGNEVIAGKMTVGADPSNDLDVTTKQYVDGYSLSIAGQFSTDAEYSVGQYVYYNKKLYRFTSAHAVGAWDASEAVEVTVGDDLSNLTDILSLQEETIPGTTQSITFDSSGNVSQIIHRKTGTSVSIRTDVFTFGINTITEVRTLSTGESLTIITNIETLETVVTYASS